MTKQQRKILLICIGVIVASYFVRYIVISAMRIAQQQAIRQTAKPKAVAISPAASPNPDSPSIANLSGIWEARGPLPGRGFCDLRVELKQNEPGRYSGYSRFSCTPMSAFTGAKTPNAIPSLVEHTMNPDGAILTGTVEKGSIHFTVDKTIGTDINGCAVTSFTVTPFGTNLVASEW